MVSAICILHYFFSCYKSSNIHHFSDKNILGKYIFKKWKNSMSSLNYFSNIKFYLFNRFIFIMHLAV